MKADLHLTSTELELMMILWEIQKGSIKDIMAQLPADRSLAYTSVSTIIRILQKKEMVDAEKQGRGHIYFPLIAKSDYEKSSIHRLVNNVFQGAPLSLVKCLIDEENLSDEDIKKLKQILKEKK